MEVKALSTGFYLRIQRVRSVFFGNHVFLFCAVLNLFEKLTFVVLSQ